jgi:alkanesulfonate monooxygenase SsuD/methylene tetrahydromethanopterin reductase-like flavin-dependent oxidoreductase (luciferase family)
LPSHGHSTATFKEGASCGRQERYGAILDEHCAAVGRDSKTIRRSANMALLITDKKDEIERLADTLAKRMGRHAADARDTCPAGTPEQIRERLCAAIWTGSSRKSPRHSGRVRKEYTEARR